MKPERQKIYDETGTPMTFKEFNEKIFFTLAGDGIRLSLDGLRFFKSKAHPIHVVDLTEARRAFPSKHFIFLARFCRKPYYIGTDNIYFLDEEEAFLFKMCDGDIENVKSVAPEKLK